MRLLKNKFLITADPEQNGTLPIMGLNGEFLKLDKRFDPYRHSTQIGKVAEVPMEFSEASFDSHTIAKGDTVWFHHFVCQPKNQWLIKGEEFYQASWEQIWAKVENGHLIPFNDWLFIEPIEESEEDMYHGTLQLHEEAEFLQQTGIVFAASEKARRMGIHEGDKIYFIPNADYSINIDDKLLWRMKIQHIIAVEHHGILTPLSDKVLIKENERSDKAERFGLILPFAEAPKQRYGKVVNVGRQIGEVVPGDEVCFLHGVYTNFYYKNEEYAIIRKENLISIQ